MNFRNFELVAVKDQQIIELRYNRELFDLHNAAAFFKLEYTITTSVLVLFWNYYYNDENNIIPIKIVFDQVEYFEILPRDAEMPKDEDDCLEQIIVGENLEFRFMGGMKIVVRAEEVSFEKQSV